MYKVSVVIFQQLLLVVGFALLAACGGGSGGGSSTEQSSQPQRFIAGAGIKGPLAFASVELYVLDTRFGELYEPGNSIAAATTDAYAQITGLAVPADIAPPYILIIDGTNAIDLNTGVAPVISKMVTVITQESLDSGKPVYATPYTTLAYQMLRLESPGDGLQAGFLDDLSIGTDLAQFNQDIIQAIGFSMPAETDIFTTPPIITADSTSIEEQQMVINYRAAIEALSSLLHKLSLSSEPFIATDSLLERLALDLRSDGIIDNSASGLTIGGIDTVVLSQNPMLLDIPNTSYRVRDTVQMMNEERSIVGSSSNIEFLIEDIAVTLEPPLLSSRLDSYQEIDYIEPVGNTANTLLLTGLIAATPVGAEVIFHQDFDAITADTVLTTNQIQDLFSLGSAGAKNEGTPGVMVVADPANSDRGNVFQVSFPKGSVRAIGGGGQWAARIPASDEYYFAYDIYVPVGYNWPLSSKLPGLFGGKLNTASGEVVPDGIQGWAARQGVVSERKEDNTKGFTGIGDGNLGGGPYTLDSPSRNIRYNYGLISKWDNNSVKLVPGKWVRIEQHIRLNTATATPGVGYKADGIYEAWADGVKVFSENKWVYRIVNSLEIDGISFVWFYGGSGDNFAAREDQAYYFDNFIVSTQPISHREVE